MKRLVLLLAAALFFGTAVSQIRYDTVRVRKGNTLFEKVISERIIPGSGVVFQKGISDSIFSDKEIEQLRKGKEVKKERLKPEIRVLVKLFPAVIADYKIISFYKLQNGAVKELGEKARKSFPVKKKGLATIWIYIPFFLIFVIGYLSMNNEEGRKGRIGFLSFSAGTIAVIIVAIIIGAVAGILAGGLAGALIGMLIGSFTGIVAGGLTKGFEGGLTGVFAGGLVGSLAGVSAGGLTTAGVSLDILWNYFLIYVSVCALVFVIREFILFFIEKKGDSVY